MTTATTTSIVPEMAPPRRQLSQQQQQSSSDNEELLVDEQKDNFNMNEGLSSTRSNDDKGGRVAPARTVSGASSSVSYLSDTNLLPPPIPKGSTGYCQIRSVKTKKGPVKKTLLHPMTIDFPENCITAILGPSGSGKSTLLSVLTNTIQSSKTLQHDSIVEIPGHSSYIPQHDALHGFFTCESYLYHYARLTDTIQYNTDDELNDMITTILGQVGLLKQRHTIVGDDMLLSKGLSGGQKRRLSIALEVLTHPENLLLDEPTTGLDSESTYQVMEFLASYVRRVPGRRVILTIHQPSSFVWNLLDHIVLLSKGQLLFSGSRDNIETFFTRHGYGTPDNWNPADHYLTLINDEFRHPTISVNEWAEFYKQWYHLQQQQNTTKGSKKRLAKGTSVRRLSSNAIGSGNNNNNNNNTTTTTPDSNNTVNKLLYQTETVRSSSIFVAFELTYRYFVNIFWNPGILGTRVAMYSAFALCMGGVAWQVGHYDTMESIQTRITVLFGCLSFFVFLSVSVLPFTIMERAIVEKEIMNKYYHPGMYQIAQVLASIPSCVILALIGTVIVLAMTKMNAPFYYFLNMFLVLSVAEAMTILVAHIVPHFVIGMAFVAGLYGFFMLFMGFMIVPSNFPTGLGWLYYVAFHTYSWRTFMFNEFQDQQFNSSATFPNGYAVLVFYEIETVNPTSDMLILAAYAVGIHLLSFIILHFRYKHCY